MLNPVSFFRTFRVIKPIERTDQIAGDAADSFKFHAATDLMQYASPPFAKIQAGS